jgi:plastocyanin
MKKVAALLLVALAALAFAACGSGDDDTSSTPAASGTTETGGNGAAGGGGESVATIDAVEGSNLAYEQKDVKVPAGKVTIEFNNPQALSHDVVVEDAEGKELGGTDLVADGTASATIDVKPGKYTFFCSVPGHREAGMEGTLTVI